MYLDMSDDTLDFLIRSVYAGLPTYFVLIHTAVVRADGVFILVLLSFLALSCNFAISHESAIVALGKVHRNLFKSARLRIRVANLKTALTICIISKQYCRFLYHRLP